MSKVDNTEMTDNDNSDYEWSPTAEWNLTPGVTTDLEALHHKITDCKVQFNMLHADMTRRMNTQDAINIVEMLGLMEQVASMTFRYVKDGGKTRRQFYEQYDDFRVRISILLQQFRIKSSGQQVNINQLLDDFAVFTRWFYDTVIKTGIWLKQSMNSALDDMSDFD